MPDQFSAASAVEFFNRKRPSREQRRAAGEKRRGDVSLACLAEIPAAAERRDALTLIREQEEARNADLLPLRYERMSADAFAYLRGAAAVMASDLSLRPNSGITVQLCGDAHLANFGMFASQERSLVFDINDFDETNPGPFEWDVKRLAASFAVAARNNGYTELEQRAASARVARSYREWMAAFNDRNTLDVWFTKVDVDWMVSQLKNSDIRKALVKASDKARRKNVDSAVMKLTEVVEGKRQFRNDPPVLTRIDSSEFGSVVEILSPVYADYVSTLQPDRAALLARYSFVDFAFKVVGVGSVGTRAYVLLLESGDGEPIVLQGKQAGPSVLERYVGESGFDNHGERVVVGTRLMQSSGDPFLGWCHGAEAAPFDFYFRQLWDMKGSIDATLLTPEGLKIYGGICGAVLARAHARAGDASMITGYLGETKDFDHAVADYAQAYADITELDYAQLLRSDLVSNS
jgi:uncharacterized protein (DUF2252 family)